ncbi:MAG: metal ABC transporter substrate-binding protein [Clostridia bacterium]
MKKFFAAIFAVAFCFTFYGCERTEVTKKDLVLCTVFPQFDFARSISGGEVNVEMLVPCGSEAHDYEPTAKDIKKISSSKLFLYIGGESDEWIKKTISSSDGKLNCVSLIDCITAPCYTNHGGEKELDEHIWTSPKNAILMARKICTEMSLAFPEKSDKFAANLKKLLETLTKLDADMAKLSKELAQKTIIIGDRNPFSYWTSDYNIKIAAAYHGCGHDSEPSGAEISKLIDLAKKQKTKSVFYVDFSSSKHLFSCHQVTNEQLAAGETYCSLINKNIKAIFEEE